MRLAGLKSLLTRFGGTPMYAAQRLALATSECCQAFVMQGHEILNV